MRLFAHHWICSSVISTSGIGIYALIYLLHQIPNNGLNAAGALIDLNLSIGSGATRIVQQTTQIIDLRARAKIVDYIVDKVE